MGRFVAADAVGGQFSSHSSCLIPTLFANCVISKFMKLIRRLLLLAHFKGHSSINGELNHLELENDPCFLGLCALGHNNCFIISERC